MAVGGDIAKFRQFVREFKGAALLQASPLSQAMLEGARREIQARIKDQFRRGVGPDDRPHAKRKDGKPALVSNKLGNAARIRVSGFGLYVEPKTKHVGDILDTNQDGHVFAGRTGNVYQYRDKRGKIISYAKFNRRIRGAAVAESEMNGIQIRAYLMQGKRGYNYKASRFVTKGVRFGKRTLVPRPIRPVSSVTDPWARALGKGFTDGFAKRVGKFAEVTR